jgi:uncharacterized repeat protein (TIGR01451 family)
LTIEGIDMKRLALLVTGALLLALTGLAPMTNALADSNSINFEPPTYVPGSIDGQDGWGGSGGTPIYPGDPLHDPPLPPYDQAIVADSLFTGAPASFGLQSFRMSNAVTSGNFADWPFSPSLAQAAGDSDAVNHGGGFVADPVNLQGRFQYSVDVASTTPGTQQPGLSVTLAPDRGDGARMSFLRFNDTPAGLTLTFQDYQDVAPYGTLDTPSDGCSGADNFQITTLGPFPSSTTHTVSVTMDLYNGPHNDVVKVRVDGNLVHTGTSWEDYYRWCTESQTTADPVGSSRPVDSILFRQGGDPCASCAGAGYLFDNLSYSSGPIPAPSADLSVSKTASPEPVHIGQKLTYTIPVHNNGPDSAFGVSLVDNLPKNAGFGSASTTQGSCTLKPAKQLVACNLGTLTSGQTVTVTIVVKPAKKGTITNTVDVTATSPTDPNMVNNHASLDTTVLP